MEPFFFFLFFSSHIVTSEINLFSFFFLFFFFVIRKLYIADARPRKNALANGAMGGGSESSSNYFQSEVSLSL